MGSGHSCGQTSSSHLHTASTVNAAGSHRLNDQRRAREINLQLFGVTSSPTTQSNATATSSPAHVVGNFGVTATNGPGTAGSGGRPSSPTTSSASNPNNVSFQSHRHNTTNQVSVNPVNSTQHEAKSGPVPKFFNGSLRVEDSFLNVEWSEIDLIRLSIPDLYQLMYPTMMSPAASVLGGAAGVDTNMGRVATSNSAQQSVDGGQSFILPLASNQIDFESQSNTQPEEVMKYIHGLISTCTLPKKETTTFTPTTWSNIQAPGSPRSSKCPGTDESDTVLVLFNFLLDNMMGDLFPSGIGKSSSSPGEGTTGSNGDGQILQDSEKNCVSEGTEDHIRNILSSVYHQPHPKKPTSSPPKLSLVQSSSSTAIISCEGEKEKEKEKAGKENKEEKKNDNNNVNLRHEAEEELACVRIRGEVEKIFTIWPPESQEEKGVQPHHDHIPQKDIRANAEDWELQQPLKTLLKEVCANTPSSFLNPGGKGGAGAAVEDTPILQNKKIASEVSVVDNVLSSIHDSQRSQALTHFSEKVNKLLQQFAEGRCLRSISSASASVGSQRCCSMLGSGAAVEFLFQYCGRQLAKMMEDGVSKKEVHTTTATLSNNQHWEGQEEEEEEKLQNVLSLFRLLIIAVLTRKQFVEILRLLYVLEEVRALLMKGSVDCSSSSLAPKEETKEEDAEKEKRRKKQQKLYDVLLRAFGLLLTDNTVPSSFSSTSSREVQLIQALVSDFSFFQHCPTKKRWMHCLRHKLVFQSESVQYRIELSMAMPLVERKYSTQTTLTETMESNGGGANPPVSREESYNRLLGSHSGVMDPLTGTFSDMEFTSPSPTSSTTRTMPTIQTAARSSHTPNFILSGSAGKAQLGSESSRTDVPTDNSHSSALLTSITHFAVHSSKQLVACINTEKKLTVVSFQAAGAQSPLSPISPLGSPKTTPFVQSFLGDGSVFAHPIWDIQFDCSGDFLFVSCLESFFATNVDSGAPPKQYLSIYVFDSRTLDLRHLFCPVQDTSLNKSTSTTFDGTSCIFQEPALMLRSVNARRKASFCGSPGALFGVLPSPIIESYPKSAKFLEYLEFLPAPVVPQRCFESLYVSNFRSGSERKSSHQALHGGVSFDVSPANSPPWVPKNQSRSCQSLTFASWIHEDLKGEIACLRCCASTCAESMMEFVISKDYSLYADATGAKEGIYVELRHAAIGNEGKAALHWEPVVSYYAISPHSGRSRDHALNSSWHFLVVTYSCSTAFPYPCCVYLDGSPLTIVVKSHILTPPPLGSCSTTMVVKRASLFYNCVGHIGSLAAWVGPISQSVLDTFRSHNLLLKEYVETTAIFHLPLDEGCGYWLKELVGSRVCDLTGLLIPPTSAASGGKEFNVNKSNKPFSTVNTFVWDVRCPVPYQSLYPLMDSESVGDADSSNRTPPRQRLQIPQDIFSRAKVLQINDNILTLAVPWMAIPESSATGSGADEEHAHRHQRSTPTSSDDNLSTPFEFALEETTIFSSPSQARNAASASGGRGNGNRGSSSNPTATATVDYQLEIDIDPQTHEIQQANLVPVTRSGELCYFDLETRRQYAYSTQFATLSFREGTVGTSPMMRICPGDMLEKIEAQQTTLVKHFDPLSMENAGGGNAEDGINFLLSKIYKTIVQEAPILEQDPLPVSQLSPLSFEIVTKLLQCSRDTIVEKKESSKKVKQQALNFFQLKLLALVHVTLAHYNKIPLSHPIFGKHSARMAHLCNELLSLPHFHSGGPCSTNVTEATPQCTYFSTLFKECISHLLYAGITYGLPPIEKAKLMSDVSPHMSLTCFQHYFSLSNLQIVAEYLVPSNPEMLYDILNALLDRCAEELSSNSKPKSPNTKSGNAALPLDLPVTCRMTIVIMAIFHTVQRWVSTASPSSNPREERVSKSKYLMILYNLLMMLLNFAMKVLKENDNFDNWSMNCQASFLQTAVLPALCLISPSIGSAAAQGLIPLVKLTEMLTTLTTFIRIVPPPSRRDSFMIQSRAILSIRPGAGVDSDQNWRLMLDYTTAKNVTLACRTPLAKEQVIYGTMTSPDATSEVKHLRRSTSDVQFKNGELLLCGTGAVNLSSLVCFQFQDVLGQWTDLFRGSLLNAHRHIVYGMLCRPPGTDIFVAPLLRGGLTDVTLANHGIYSRVSNYPHREGSPERKEKEKEVKGETLISIQTAEEVRTQSHRHDVCVLALEILSGQGEGEVAAQELLKALRGLVTMKTKPIVRAIFAVLCCFLSVPVAEEELRVRWMSGEWSSKLVGEDKEEQRQYLYNLCEWIVTKVNSQSSVAHAPQLGRRVSIDSSARRRSLDVSSMTRVGEHRNMSDGALMLKKPSDNLTLKSHSSNLTAAHASSTSLKSSSRRGSSLLRSADCSSGFADHLRALFAKQIDPSDLEQTLATRTRCAQNAVEGLRAVQSILQLGSSHLTSEDTCQYLDVIRMFASGSGVGKSHFIEAYVGCGVHLESLVREEYSHTINLLLSHAIGEAEQLPASPSQALSPVALLVKPAPHGQRLLRLIALLCHSWDPVDYKTLFPTGMNYLSSQVFKVSDFGEEIPSAGGTPLFARPSDPHQAQSTSVNFLTRASQGKITDFVFRYVDLALEATIEKTRSPSTKKGGQISAFSEPSVTASVESKLQILMQVKDEKEMTEEFSYRYLGIADLDTFSNYFPNSFSVCVPSLKSSISSLGIGIERTVSGYFSLRADEGWSLNYEEGLPRVFYMEVSLESKFSDFSLSLCKPDKVSMKSSAAAQDVCSLDAKGKMCVFGTETNFGCNLLRGDIVGVGLVPTERKIFFTINGKFITRVDVLPDTISCLFPCVSFDCKDVMRLLVNFGSSPFRFDFRRLHPSLNCTTSSSVASSSLESSNNNHMFGAPSWYMIMNLAITCYHFLICRATASAQSTQDTITAAILPSCIESVSKALEKVTESYRQFEASSPVQSTVTEPRPSTTPTRYPSVAESDKSGGSSTPKEPSGTRSPLLEMLSSSSQPNLCIRQKILEMLALRLISVMQHVAKVAPTFGNPYCQDLSRLIFQSLSSVSHLSESSIKISAYNTLLHVLPHVTEYDPTEDRIQLVSSIFKQAKQPHLDLVRTPHPRIEFVASWQQCDQRSISITSPPTCHMLPNSVRSVVLGTLIPRRGKVTFTVCVSRDNMAKGHSLQGGYFIGVSVPNLQTLTPMHSSQSWKLQKPPVVWAIHDISPQLGHALVSSVKPNNFKRIFGSGDKIEVEVDRDEGVVTFYRDGVFLAKLFEDLPVDRDLCPFVQLYNSDATAVLSSGTMEAPLTQNQVAGAAAVDILRGMITLPPFGNEVAQLLTNEIAEEKLPLVSLSVFGSLPDPRHLVLFHPGGECDVVVGRVRNNRCKIMVMGTILSVESRNLRCVPHPVPAGFAISSSVWLDGLRKCIHQLVDTMRKVLVPILTIYAAEASERGKREGIAIEEEQGWDQLLASERHLTYQYTLEAMSTVSNCYNVPCLEHDYRFSKTLSSPGLLISPQFFGRHCAVLAPREVQGALICIAEPALPMTGKLSIRCQLSRGHPGQVFGGGYYFGVCSSYFNWTRKEPNANPPYMWAVYDMDEEPWRLRHIKDERRFPAAIEPSYVLLTGDTVRLEIDRDAGTMSAYRRPFHSSEEVFLGLIFDNLPMNTQLYPFVQVYYSDSTALLFPPGVSSTVMRATYENAKFGLKSVTERRACDSCASQHRETRLTAPHWFKCNECGEYDLCSACFYSGMHSSHSFTRMDPSCLMYSHRPPTKLLPGSPVVVAGCLLSYLRSTQCIVNDQQFRCLVEARNEYSMAMWSMTLHSSVKPTVHARFDRRTPKASVHTVLPMILGIGLLSEVAALCTSDLLVACLEGKDSVICYGSDSRCRKNVQQESRSPYGFDYRECLQLIVDFSSQTMKVMRDWIHAGSIPLPSSFRPGVQLVAFAFLGEAATIVETLPDTQPVLTGTVTEIIPSRIALVVGSNGEQRWAPIHDLRVPYLPVNSSAIQPPQSALVQQHPLTSYVYLQEGKLPESVILLPFDSTSTTAPLITPSMKTVRVQFGSDGSEKVVPTESLFGTPCYVEPKKPTVQELDLKSEHRATVSDCFFVSRAILCLANMLEDLRIAPLVLVACERVYTTLQMLASVDISLSSSQSYEKVVLDTLEVSSVLVRNTPLLNTFVDPLQPLIHKDGTASTLAGSLPLAVSVSSSITEASFSGSSIVSVYQNNKGSRSVSDQLQMGQMVLVIEGEYKGVIGVVVSDPAKSQVSPLSSLAAPPQQSTNTESPGTLPLFLVSQAALCLSVVMHPKLQLDKKLPSDMHVHVNRNQVISVAQSVNKLPWWLSEDGLPCNQREYAMRLQSKEMTRYTLAGDWRGELTTHGGNMPLFLQLENNEDVKGEATVQLLDGRVLNCMVTGEHVRSLRKVTLTITYPPVGAHLSDAELRTAMKNFKLPLVENITREKMLSELENACRKMPHPGWSIYGLMDANGTRIYGSWKHTEGISGTFIVSCFVSTSKALAETDSRLALSRAQRYIEPLPDILEVKYPVAPKEPLPVLMHQLVVLLARHFHLLLWLREDNPSAPPPSSSEAVRNYWSPVPISDTTSGNISKPESPDAKLTSLSTSPSVHFDESFIGQLFAFKGHPLTAEFITALLERNPKLFYNAVVQAIRSIHISTLKPWDLETLSSIVTNALLLHPRPSKEVPCLFWDALHSIVCAAHRTGSTYRTEVLRRIVKLIRFESASPIAKQLVGPLTAWVEGSTGSMYIKTALSTDLCVGVELLLTVEHEEFKSTYLPVASLRCLLDIADSLEKNVPFPAVADVGPKIRSKRSSVEVNCPFGEYDNNILKLGKIQSGHAVRKRGRYYYEVILPELSSAYAIGWGTSQHVASDRVGQHVGSDPYSFAYVGSQVVLRQVREDYSLPVEPSPSSVVGALLDLDEKVVAWSINGRVGSFLPLPFEMHEAEVFAFTSVGTSSGMKPIFNAKGFRYPPVGYSDLAGKSSSISLSDFDPKSRSSLPAQPDAFYDELSQWMNDKDYAAHGKNYVVDPVSIEAYPRLQSVDIKMLPLYMSHIIVTESCVAASQRYVDLQSERMEGQLSSAFIRLRSIVMPKFRKTLIDIPPTQTISQSSVQVVFRWTHLFSALPRSHEAALHHSVLNQMYKQIGYFEGKDYSVCPLFQAQLILTTSGHTPQDLGGPYRQAWVLLADELMTHPDSCYPHTDFHRNPLFRFTANSQKLCLVPEASATSVAELQLFHFFGKLMGYAARSNTPLACDISPFVWKYFAEEKLDINSYYADVDSVVRRSLEDDDFLASDMIEELVSGFSPTLSDLLEEQEMLQGGNAMVTEEVQILNSPTSVMTNSSRSMIELRRRAAQEALLHSLDLPMEAMRRGLASVLTFRVLRCMSWSDLERAVCGDQTIPFDKLKSEGIIMKLSPVREQFFWKLLEEMTSEQRSQLLYFSCGQKRLPLAKRIQVIENSESIEHFPRAQSCPAVLSMPLYPTYELMKEKILTAIRHQEMELA